MIKIEKRQEYVNDEPQGVEWYIERDEQDNVIFSNKEINELYQELKKIIEK